ncbi:hypothetical protein TRFO_27669 [Tritrichomonas foetus]|uniref:Peptidase M60 domain-containing protein n=1 Tax=Tritrichomonas foetus TaxID=1144522 RepID=A0A1J4K062_9EUKA|nr:hypothetical protein TRFO_27669 [Tritrichomonas foetus]|eukprot:OHT04807.1 hypothetical protein TRFO_27669 [Tritrichomonas foetus]
MNVCHQIFEYILNYNFILFFDIMELNWVSGSVTEAWGNRTWDITPHVKVQGKYSVHFQYTKGYHQLEIKSVQILCDDRKVSEDNHFGVTGCNDRNNTYFITIESELTTTILLSAMVRSDGGCDSNGIISIKLIEPSFPKNINCYKALASLALPQLLKNVTDVDINECIAGTILCKNDRSFPVICDSNGRSLVCACLAGKGKIVAFGHPCFLNDLNIINKNKNLIQNAIQWTSNNNNRIGFYNYQIEEIFQGTRMTDSENFSNFDTICFCDSDIPLNKIDDLRKYVFNGGGIVTTCIGWGWSQLHPNKSIKNDNPFNKFFPEFGLVNSRDCSWKPYKILSHDSNFHFLQTFSGFSSDRVAQGDYDPYLLKCYLSNTPNEFDYYSSLLNSRCYANASLDDKYCLSMISAKMENCEYLHAQNDIAKIYPGLPEKNNFISQKVVISPTNVTDQWHSTGLFAVAGEPFTIHFHSHKINYNFSDVVIRVGTTTCDISNHKEWSRAPNVSAEYPLRSSCDAFMHPYGGLIYIILKKPFQNPVKFTFSHVIEAICYSEDSQNSWNDEKNTKFAPMAEIIGKNVIFTVTREFALKIKDIKAFIEGWDKIVQLEDDLACTHRERPERICCDCQLCAGYMHSGYPIMVPISALVDIDEVARDGSWGFFHEIGHNHQSHDWTYESAGEVTVNIFSLYVSKQFAKKDIRTVWGMGDLDDKIANFVQNGKLFSDLKNDFVLHLGIYQRIALEFGFEVFTRFFMSFMENDSVHPTNDEEKIDQWAIRMSKINNCDMGKVFQTWSFPISSEALHFCSQFKKAPQSLTTGF